MDIVIAVRGLPVAEESSEVLVITAIPAVVSEAQADFKEEIPIPEHI
ncbi:hypothetical protein P147_WWE3C00001G0262 [candidate division WWE3 bacterium RAAC2_WWE3_1]|nr:hypothetical protein P147_WWE3C00001G0262 [candidate division WWE3 bacterium RAAC2_WWE3_1]